MQMLGIKYIHPWEMTRMQFILYSTLGAFCLSLLLILFINLHIISTTSSRIYAEVQDIPESQTGLVLGAFVYSDGTLSTMLKDRCDSAIILYNAGKIQKILVSGDHGRKEYDEVNSMKNYILNKGVASEDIFTDHAGFDTYDSMYRARDIFKVDSITIITQGFHLPRAVYTAKSLGINAIGFRADLQVYAGGTFTNELREILSRSKAFIDLLMQNKPVYLGEAIPITGNSELSWD